MKTPRNWTRHDDMAAYFGGLLIKFFIFLVFAISMITDLSK